MFRIFSIFVSLLMIRAGAINQTQTYQTNIEPFREEFSNQKLKIYQMILYSTVPQEIKKMYIVCETVHKIMAIMIGFSLYKFQNGITPVKNINKKEVEAVKVMGALTSVGSAIYGLSFFFSYFVFYKQDRDKYLLYEFFLDSQGKVINDLRNDKIIIDFVTSICCHIIILITILKLRYPTESFADIFKKKTWDFKEIKVEKNASGQNFHVVSTYTDLLITHILPFIFIMFIVKLYVIATRYYISNVVTKMTTQTIYELLYIPSSQSPTEIIQTLYL